jgi:cellulose synthase/poly-beta-1,6-N-acetylglucosamine synthase-like glycosyltransferase
MMLGLLIVLITILFGDLLLIFLFLFNNNKYTVSDCDKIPVVSILVAMKDEEANVKRCLDSLLRLSYPTDKLEILVGNDASEDGTLIMLNEYTQKFEHIKVFDITEKVGKQHGKANALAQLVQQARGEYYLITDADMSLPKDWVQSMLSAMTENIGLAIGVTHVEGNRLQDLDWLYGLAMIKVVTDLNKPVTGMGNNMIISKEAYQSVGGYEALPFSITEDYELFKYVKERGYQCAHVYQKEVLGKTLPINGFLNLLNQRKRWMKGAIQLPRLVIGLLSLQPLFYLGATIMLLIDTDLALILVVIKLLLRMAFMSVMRYRLQLPFRFLSIVIYEVYALIIAITSVLYYWLPFEVKWKGRTY